VLLRSDHIEDAFADAQTNGVQLVTTQRKFLEREWNAALDRHGAAWLLVTEGASEGEITHPLARAYREVDAAPRLAACVAMLNAERTAATLVATASVCMEVNDLDAAARDLDEAIRLAPEWAAAHYERGKLCLRSEDMEGAAEAFRRAADLLPTFVSSWGNLGAALGELDRPTEALAAFERALAIEPSNVQALNNVGVVRRELGRLAESEAAFRQAIQLMPGMAFGHYNLGHTLFLQGRSGPPSRRTSRGRRGTPSGIRCRRRAWRSAKWRRVTRAARWRTCSAPRRTCRASTASRCWVRQARSCGPLSRSIRK